MVGNEGEKSWINLLSEYYGGYQIIWPGIEGSNADTVILLSNFTFLRSGSYYTYNGNLNGRTMNSYYWSIRAHSLQIARALNSLSIWLNYQNVYNKGEGLSLR